MNRSYFLLFAILLFGFCISFSYSTESGTSERTLSNIPSAEYMLSNSCLGTDFWIALPQNDLNNSQFGEIAIEVVVTSYKNTKVTLEVPFFGFSKTKQVTAFQQTLFSGKDGEAQFAWEIKESDKVLQYGIHVYSPDPISVYLVSQRMWSSDGYLAIPVSSWGKDYIHNSYYDFQWSHAQYGGNRSGGFVVVAAENGTKINVKLAGAGGQAAKAAGGKKIGDYFSVSLNQGETYMIRGDGTTNGLFDISGSRITSNKPIGVISYHQMTFVPTFAPNGGSYLVEMLPPVNSWGRKFVTVQFPRSPKGSSDGRGDFFRLLVAEDSTYLHIKYYDPETGEMKGQLEQIIKKSGDFFEFLHTDVPAPNKKHSIYGVSVWETDKPAMLMQYSYTSLWDDITEWAPFMVLIPPVEQYIKSSLFQTPSIKSDFKVNQLTLFVEGDRADPTYKKLKTVKINGEEIYKKDAKLLSNNITGTDIYWTRINLDRGAYYLESETKVSGYLYGTCSWNTSGWPALFSVNKINEYDSSAPRLEISENCGNFIVTATEIINGKPGDNPKQTDQGISKIIVFEELLKNFDYYIEKPEIPLPWFNQKIFFNTKDHKLPAFAKFGVLDRAGNYVMDSVYYNPDSIKIANESLNFGNSRINRLKEMNAIITNTGSKEVEILKIKCRKDSQCFKLADTTLKNGFILSPMSSRELCIQYQPTTESTGNGDTDTLLIASKCYDLKIALSGKGVSPHIVIEDYDFGKVNAGSIRCLEEVNLKGFLVENNGSDTVTVTELKGIMPPFEIKNPNFQFPYKIAPKQIGFFKSMCFLPVDSGDYAIEIKVESDAPETDKNISLLKGTGFKKKDTTGIEEYVNEIPEFIIAPNPATEDEIVVRYRPGNKDMKIKDSDNLKLELIDVLGNICLSSDSFAKFSDIYEFKFRISSISKGMYLIRLSTGNSQINRKLCIVR